MTMFSPKNYDSIDALHAAMLFDAHSDTSIDNIDVFGYFDGIPYACVNVDDTNADVVWTFAGDRIL
jgi:hypothetical protein